MKFGKRLQHQMEETLPEWRDKFLSYKRLKKLLRLIATKGVAPPPEREAASAAAGTEAEFLRLLNAEVEKFNTFFIEQEEDFVIRHKELKERVEDVVRSVGPAGVRPSETEYAAEISRIRKDVVNLHGEMVLLENYSNVNYTGLAKILKKYDKQTKRLLRLPFIEKVLEQPFFTTDLVSGLVKEVEDTIVAVFPKSSMADTIVWELQRDNLELQTISDRKAGKMEELIWGPVIETEQGIMRNTVAALVTMQELRRGSSTYGHFSLPPLDMSLLPDSMYHSSPLYTSFDRNGI